MTLQDFDFYEKAVVSGIAGKGPGVDTILSMLTESFNTRS